MKKFLFVFGLFFSFYGSILGQPIAESDAWIITPPKTPVGDGGCYEIIWGFDNYDVYSLCDNSNNNGFENLRIVEIPCNSNCVYGYTLYIDGNKKELNRDDGLGYNFNLKAFLKDYYIEFLDREKVIITIEVSKKCNGGKKEISTNTQVIQFAGKGMKYYQYEDLGWEDPPGYYVCDLYKNGDDLYKNDALYNASHTCCRGSQTVTLSYEESITSNSGHLGGTNVGVNIKLGPNIGINFSQSIQFPFVINSTTSSFGIESSVTLKGNENGVCEYAAIYTSHKHIHEYVYIEDCDPNTVEMPVEENDYWVPMNHYLVKCEDYAICNPPNGNIEEFNEHRKLMARDECSKELKMAVTDENYNYTYTWTLPDGTVIEGESIILADQPGLYTCLVKDECCNEKEFQYNNCNQLSYENWFYENGQYCTTVTCNCIPTFRSPNDNTYIMCVTPQRYDSDWSFDDSRKMCTKHAYWTDQNGMEIDLTDAVNEDDIDAEDENVVKEPEVIEYFDESSKQCIREYRCEDDNSQGSIEQDNPEYGDWQYDDFYEKCYREVFCFGDDDPAEDEDGWEVKDEGDSEIEWDFDEDDYMCYGIVYCDDDETDIEVEEDPDAVWYWDDDNNKCTTDEVYCDDAEQDGMSEEGDDFGDWEYDGSDCYRSVFCNLANEKFTDYAEEVKTNYDSEWENQCGDDECTYYITCDGDEISHDYYLCGGCPEGLIKGEYLIDKSHLTKGKPILLSGEDVIYSKKKKSYNYYKIQIYTIDGKINKFVGKKRVKDVEAFISFFKKYKARPNIMYFYLVFGENELLYSKKFIEFKK